jgi:hypothetical protein
MDRGWQTGFFSFSSSAGRSLEPLELDWAKWFVALGGPMRLSLVNHDQFHLLRRGGSRSSSPPAPYAKKHIDPGTTILVVSMMFILLAKFSMKQTNTTRANPIFYLKWVLRRSLY